MNVFFILHSSNHGHALGMKFLWSWFRKRNPKQRTSRREEETRDLEHFRSDVGLNYDAGFGSLTDDVAAADVDRTMHEHPKHGE